MKGNQEYFLIDVDRTALKGKVITGALLHVRSDSFRGKPFARVGASTLASPWQEGNSKNYRPQKGSSSYSQAKLGSLDWSYPGSTLMDVVFGKGHTIWRFSDCTRPDANGWQTCAIDPSVVAARIAGLSYGFCLYDEVGNEWSIKNGNFKYSYAPNRFCYSRESWGSDPWLEVWTAGSDEVAPNAIDSLSADTGDLPSGEALISWITPKDHGGGYTLGFQVHYRNKGVRKPVPRYLIPMAGHHGEEVRMHLQDLGLDGGETIELEIKPVDSVGNVGPGIKKTIRVSEGFGIIEIPEAAPRPFTSQNSQLVVGGVEVAVVDLLDKVDPRNGEIIPKRGNGYRHGNHIFSANQKLIRLQAARNETICFQIVLSGKTKNLAIRYEYRNEPTFHPTIFQFAYVRTSNIGDKEERTLPDPLVPVVETISIPSTAGKVYLPDQSFHSLICELYVPSSESPGEKRGTVEIEVESEKLVLDVNLTVWDFTLPDKLSFVPEMNAYGTFSPYNSYEYYRLAHEHRTCINRLPYGWSGQPEFAPNWKGKQFEWAEWDRHVGPLLDGSAFNGCRRKSEPVDVFYLPFNENWPVDIYDHFIPSYWADEAFSSAYADELSRAFKAFADHCNQKNWDATVFQFYLNNKVYHRERFPKNSAPWIFDEPMNTQDFWALRWYGILWQSSVSPVRGKINMWFRADVSFSQFQRNILWDVLDIEYIGGNTAQKTRMKLDQQRTTDSGYFAEYGTANAIGASNFQPVLWCLSAWAKGASGVLPWQTIGSDSCWKKGEQTALFYPNESGPLPSVRLKAFTRGQQDVEYLTMLSKELNVPQNSVSKWLKSQIVIKERIQTSYPGDAGTYVFEKAAPAAIWKLRYRIGRFLSEKAPPYRRALVAYKQPKWDTENLPNIGYVGIAPHVDSIRPVCDRFRPAP